MLFPTATLSSLIIWIFLFFQFFTGVPAQSWLQQLPNPQIAPYPPPKYIDLKALNAEGFCSPAISCSPTITYTDGLGMKDVEFNAKEINMALSGGLSKDGVAEGHMILRLLQGNNEQRQQIIEHLIPRGKPLTDYLNERLPLWSKDFKNVLIALMKRPEVYDAEELHQAFSYLASKRKSSLFSNEEKRNVMQILEILLTRTKSQIYLVNLKYYEMYKTTLCEEVGTLQFFNCKNGGDIKGLLIYLCNPNEQAFKNSPDPYGPTFSVPTEGFENWAERELEKGLMNSKETTNQILALVQQKPSILRNIFARIDTSKIAKQCTGSDYYRMAYEYTVEVVQNRALFFAKLIHDSVKPIGTHDGDLIRQIVSQAEIDLRGITAAYEKLPPSKKAIGGFLKAKKATGALVEAVTGDTSGYYQRTLLGLITLQGKADGRDFTYNTLS